MSSLAELPELIGFFSYSREDDVDSHGALSELRNRIQGELRGQLGRTTKSFRLWQDKEAIPAGTLWEAEIKTAVGQSVFFIPIITPTVVASPFCRFEFEAFLEREAVLGRTDLVFPMLYIDVPALQDSARRQNDPLLAIIAKRQYVDWREFRYLDINSTEVKKAIGRFSANIRDALHRPWVSPEERRKQEEAAIRAQEEEQRRRHEAEEKRRAEEQSRREQEEAEAQRIAARRQQEKTEAERRAQEDEHRKEVEADARRRADEERRAREAEAEQRAKEEQAFAAAKRADSISALDEFLAEFRTFLPTGKLADQVRRRLQRLAGPHLLLHALAKNWWLLFLRGICAVLFGVSFIIGIGQWQLLQWQLFTFVLLFSAYALADGVLAVAQVVMGGALASSWWLALVGLLGIVAGSLGFVWPYYLIPFAFLRLIASWAIAIGILQIVGAIRLRKEIQNEWLLIASGALSAIVGLILMAEPWTSALRSLTGLYAVGAVGIYAVLYGILEVWLSLRLRGYATRAAREYSTSH
jgi:uncharacterized membrane protein HdeD (DUF308 family)